MAHGPTWEKVIEAREGRPVADVLRDLFAQGMTEKQVAARYAISVSTVVRMLRRHGLCFHRTLAPEPREGGRDHE